MAAKRGAKRKAPDEEEKSWAVVSFIVLSLFASMYIFLLGLWLLGIAFKVLGGRGAGAMFSAIENPIAGLMVGVLATVFVQSSSTTTSIVVGLVGADQITVRTGIPVVMGANIGTSVTNTFVSMGHMRNRLELQRAFAGATVQDMFNYLTVLTLLPLEIVVAAISGEGGILYWLTKAITDSIIGAGKAGELFRSPVKELTSPVAELIISPNTYVITALTLGAPLEKIPNMTSTANCTRRLAAAPAAIDAAVEDLEPLSRRMSDGGMDCSKYYCVSKALDNTFKQLSKSYENLTKCDGYIVDPAEPCRKDEKCYIDGGNYYKEKVADGQIITGGLLEGVGDAGGGIIALCLSLLLLTLGLYCLTKCLKAIFMGRAKKLVAKSTKLNDYLALLAGIGLTIVVQSSSVVTTALTPFCGMGVLPLEKMFPLTLGANIGTTVTTLIAALTKMTSSTVQIALCHILFNVIGVLIWFPIPGMRQVPLSAARLLGLYASFYRATPVCYVILAFVLAPVTLVGVSALFGISLPAGIFLVLGLLAALAWFEYWWVCKEGCYKLISKEEREERMEEVASAQREILETEEENDV